MTSNPRDLYRETIVDHGRRPRNFGKLTGATHHATGHNPLCGDKVEVHVQLDGSTIEDIRFEGFGCAISIASASLMTLAIEGRSSSHAHALSRAMEAIVSGEKPAGTAEDIDLGELAVFENLRSYPLRAKCATLAWHTLVKALRGEDD